MLDDKPDGGIFIENRGFLEILMQRQYAVKRMPNENYVAGMPLKQFVNERQDPRMVWGFVDPAGLSLLSGVRHEGIVNHAPQQSPDVPVCESERSQTLRHLRIVYEGMESEDELRFRRTCQQRVCVEQIA